MRKIYGIGETVLDIIFKNGQPQACQGGRFSTQQCGFDGQDRAAGFPLSASMALMMLAD